MHNIASPRNDDTSIELAIQAKGLNGPRVKPEHIEALMASVKVYTQRIEPTCSTIALAVLPSGFTVGIGHSACVDPSNFNAEIGERVARENALAQARNKLWELEGYLLKHELTRAQYGQ